MLGHSHATSGAFAWSAGLETAIADRRVTDSERLKNWIEGALAHGGVRTDAIVLAEAWRVVRGIELVASPLPTSPTRGEVPAGDWGTFSPDAPAHTSPLVGEAGRGEAARTALSDLADLSLALGCKPRLDQTDAPVVEAQQQIVAACKRHGVVAGIHNATSGYALKMMEAGYQFLTLASDSRFMAARAAEEASAVKKSSKGGKLPAY